MILFFNFLVVTPKNPEEKQQYYNRKGWYSLNALVLVGCSGKIYSVDADNPGGVADSKTWHFSSLKALLQSSGPPFEGAVAGGDSGFPAKDPFIMVNFSNVDVARNRKKKKFNGLFKPKRTVCEREFGCVKQKYQVLMTKIRFTDIRESVKMIENCFALHNFQLHHNPR